MHERKDRKRRCTVCGIRCWSETSLCAQHRPTEPVKRPQGPCSDCSRITTAHDRICRTCAHKRPDYTGLSIVDAARDDTLALSDGSWWRRRDGLLVWIPWSVGASGVDASRGVA